MIISRPVNVGYRPYEGGIQLVDGRDIADVSSVAAARVVLVKVVLTLDEAVALRLLAVTSMGLPPLPILPELLTSITEPLVADILVAVALPSDIVESDFKVIFPVEAKIILVKIKPPPEAVFVISIFVLKSLILEASKT